jgi:hypothetical protein
MKNILKKIDLFPENINLNVNGKGPKKTLTGGLLTLISILSALVVTIILINDFIYNRKINLISQTQYDPEMKPINIYASDLQFTFSIWDTQNFKILPAPFSYSHIVQADLDVVKILSPNQNPESIRVWKGEFIPCNTNNTSKDFMPFITKFQLIGYDASKIYCSNLNMTGDYLLSGGNIFYSQRQNLINFYFEVDTCKIDPVNCKNNTYMNQNALQMLIMYKDNYFNVLEPKGYSPFLNTLTLPFIVGKSIDLNVDLIKNELVTDKALFLNNEEKSYFYSYENIRHTTNDKINTYYTKSNEETIFAFNVYIQTPLRFQIYNRTFSKIDSLFASINVLIALSFMIGRVLTMVINLGEIDHYIMKRLYFFSEDDEEVLETIKTEQIKINKMKKKDSESPRLLINDIKNQLSKKANNKYPTTESVDEEFNPFEYLLKKKNLEKNWIASLLYSIGLSNCIKLTRPNILFKNGKSLLRYDLNAIIIIKKLMHFESLLNILFNDDQMNLLKVIRSRYINATMNIEEKVNELQKLNNGINDKCQVYHINQSYKDCCNEKNPLNKKIIQLL